jgi:hypothetical protein
VIIRGTTAILPLFAPTIDGEMTSFATYVALFSVTTILVGHEKLVLVIVGLLTLVDGLLLKPLLLSAL